MSIKLTPSPNYPDVNCSHCGAGYNVVIPEDMQRHAIVSGNWTNKCTECNKVFQYRIQIEFWQPDNERIRFLHMAKALNRTERERLIGGLEAAKDDTIRMIAGLAQAGVDENTSKEVGALQVLFNEYEELIKKLR